MLQIAYLTHFLLLKIVHRSMHTPSKQNTQAAYMQCRVKAITSPIAPHNERSHLAKMCSPKHRREWTAIKVP